jgi:signal transduction histidine kinase
MTTPTLPEFSLPTSYAGDLQRALNRVAWEMTVSLDADACLVYWVTPDGLCIPLVASGVVTDKEKTEFFSTSLDSSTDLLVDHLLTHRTSVASSRVKKDTRISPSILTQFKSDAALAVPVFGNSRVMGLVIAMRRGRHDPFTMNQVSLAEAISGSIALALENAQLYQATQARLVETQSLHQVSLALLQKLELEEVLQIVCTEAQRMTGAKGSSVGLVEGEEWLRIMYSTGESMEKPGRVPIGQSMLGLAVRRGEPLIINNRPGLRDDLTAEAPVSLLAIPLKVQGQIIGVLDVVNKEHGFSQEDVRLIELFANQAALAVENTRLAKQVQEMAVVEERHRLSRELHDSVNQLLYGMALYTQAAQRKLETGDLKSVRSHLQDLEDSSREALKEMRLLIFELRPSVLDSAGLQNALTQRLKTVEEQVGLTTAFKWRVNGQLDSKIEEMLYGISQEALNNVVKHAKARNVTVHLIQSGHVLILKIEDDGVGFDVQSKGKGGIGLRTMRERAESQNADLVINSAPGEGTSLMVEVKV